MWGIRFGFDQLGVRGWVGGVWFGLGWNWVWSGLVGGGGEMGFNYVSMGWMGIEHELDHRILSLLAIA